MPDIAFYTGGIAQTNAFLVNNEGWGALAVDAPEGFADWLAQRGARVDVLFLTHQHFDHVMDAARIQREHGAKILAFSPFSSDLTLERLFSFAAGVQIRVEPFRVDEVLEGKRGAQAGGMAWSLEHIPGHSSDSLALIAREQRLAFVGDTLFLGGIGRTDFPGGSTALLLDGIQKKLLSLEDDVVLHPGHGQSTTAGRERRENPFLPR